MSREKIAIVGCGVAGLSSAYLLRNKYEIHLFEKNQYAGGHTRTLSVPDGPDIGTPVDTGFIVMNHRNYPHFTKLLNELEVNIEDSCMSFSYYDETRNYGYAGNGLGSIFPNAKTLFNPEHWSMLKDILKFAKVGYKDLNEGTLNDKTLGEYLDFRSFGKAFRSNYLYPMGAAIWSSPLRQMSEFPAEPYIHFLENHGLLRLTNRPQWKYVSGGSKTYVKSLLGKLDRSPILGAQIKSIQRKEDQVIIHHADGHSDSFDQIIIGAHADEALKLLGDPSKDETRLLGAWRYQDNDVVLHTSRSAMPPQKKLWSSWNFIREESTQSDSPVSVSYYMNRLQALDTKEDYMVSLNRQSSIPQESIINQTTLTHPQYDFSSIATQKSLSDINGSKRTWFCGSYFGYGFHEDAVRSAVEVAKKLGVDF